MVSPTVQSMCCYLTVYKGFIQTCYEHGPDRGSLDPKNEPADVFIQRTERRHVSRTPGIVREHRIVELDNSPRVRRDASPEQPRRSSRLANPQRREMMLINKGML